MRPRRRTSAAADTSQETNAIRGVSGEIDVELGVGDLSIEGSDADFGDIEVESGVGEIHLEQRGGHREKDSIFGNSIRATGRGKSPLRVEIGVGEASVELR